jgi:hypothetical protein
MSDTILFPRVKPKKEPYTGKFLADASARTQAKYKRAAKVKTDNINHRPSSDYIQYNAPEEYHDKMKKMRLFYPHKHPIYQKPRGERTYVGKVPGRSATIHAKTGEVLTGAYTSEELGGIQIFRKLQTRPQKTRDKVALKHANDIIKKTAVKKRKSKETKDVNILN